ncbi:MAG: carboxypeptidase-like regulatory domain-containing protein [Cyclobacteriaceae bacterium]
MRVLSLLSLMLLLSVFSHCDVKDALDEVFIDISGNVSEDGAAVEGALILLLDSPDITDGVSLSNGSATGAGGDYTIVGVKEGSYYVVAVDDVNNNFEFDKDTDRFGFHGVDPSQADLLPALVTVSSDDVENIDIIYFIE